MKDKSISKRAGALLNYFLQKDQACFTYAQALKAHAHLSRNGIAKLLSDMTHQGLLMRVKEGLYYIIPYEQDAASFMPDWHLLASYLVQDRDYYIGYYSALQIHGLITQPSLKEQIVVNEQMRPSLLSIRAIPFQFIYHNTAHFFGYQKTWIDDFHQVNCADIEKTLIDSLFKPYYAGGIVEITRAMCLAKDQLDPQKLFTYTKQFSSQAVIKRLGFLLELLNVHASLLNKLQKIKSRSFVLLDPEMPPTGKRMSRWSIQQNIDSNTIQSALLT